MVDPIVPLKCTNNRLGNVPQILCTRIISNGYALRFTLCLFYL